VEYLAGRTEIEHYDAEGEKRNEEVKVFIQEQIKRKQKKFFLQRMAWMKVCRNYIARAMAKKWVDFMMRFRWKLWNGLIKSLTTQRCISQLLALTSSGGFIESAYFVTDNVWGLKLLIVLLVCLVHFFGIIKVN